MGSCINNVYDTSCTRCKKLSKNALSVCLPGAGPESASIMFVGEAPGEKEDQAGRPFIGPAGKFFDKHMLRGAGIKRDEVFVTNAVKCRPENNKTPSITYINNCRSFLEKEVECIRPKVIVAMGNVALHSMIPLKERRTFQDVSSLEKPSQGAVTGITKWRGKAIWHSRFNCWVVPTFHPSGLRRSFGAGYRHDLELAVRDLELASRLVKKRPPKKPELKVYFADTVSKAIQVLKGVQKRKGNVIATDIETTGLNKSDSLVGFSLSDREGRGFFIDASLLQDKVVDDLFRKFLLNDDVIKVFHNIEFDERFLRFKGYSFSSNPSAYSDTMVAASLLDENFSKGLKELTWRYLPFGGYDAEMKSRLKEIGGWENLTAKDAWKYGAMDAIVTRMLWFKFEPLLKEQHLYPLFSKVLMPVRKIMTDTEVYGFMVDIQRARALQKRCSDAANVLKKRLIGKISKKYSEYSSSKSPLNLRSPKQLSDILFAKLKAKPLKKTKTGYSTDGASLDYIVSNLDGRQPKSAVLFVRSLLKIRYFENQLSKFIRPLLTSADEKGVIHTRYNITGTVTGRTSCSDPGIHNIPRDAAIRTLFVARPGYSLVHADLDRAELSVLNAYCKDKGLAEALKGDPHSEVFKAMFGKPSDYIPTEDERFIGKAINFGLIYGRGPASLAAALGCSVETAMEYINRYFERYPLVKSFLHQNVRDTKERGYAISFFYRKRRLPEIHSDNPEVASKAERQANNSLIQSTSADYTYLGIVRTIRFLRKANIPFHIVHTVHDCVVVETPDRFAEKAAEWVKKAFEAPVKGLPLKMSISYEIVKRWGEKGDSKLLSMLKEAV